MQIFVTIVEDGSAPKAVEMTAHNFDSLVEVLRSKLFTVSGESFDFNEMQMSVRGRQSLAVIVTMVTELLRIEGVSGKVTLDTVKKLNIGAIKAVAIRYGVSKNTVRDYIGTSIGITVKEFRELFYRLCVSRGKDTRLFDVLRKAERESKLNRPEDARAIDIVQKWVTDKIRK